MRRKRVSPNKNQRRPRTTKAGTSRKHLGDLEKSLRRQHFAGLALSGGKNDKACIALVEFYPEQNKIFLSHILDKLKGTEEKSSDQQIVEELSRAHYPIEMIGVNAPLSEPKCMRCQVSCPGYEACTEPEIQWMWEQRKKIKGKKEQKKIFTPYTERCAEQWVASELEEPFHAQHAMGANMAPLYARAHYLLRRLKIPAVEVFPKVSLWRIGNSLNIQKSYLRFHKHSVGGDDARLAILKELVERNIAFLYEQDVRLMVNNGNAFDAFICALTAVLKTKGQCVERPKGFPEDEGWIEVPKQDIIW